ncbi:MAG: LysR family transcriptional regulator [Burkholderiales bacterium]|nr:LysR family transcriptional regulator [Burkholderiales bacterium]
MLTNQWKSKHLGMWELLFKVFEKGSVSRVADESGVDRGQLSRMIKALENEVGCELVERIGRTAKPTLAGAQARKEILPLLESLDKTIVDLTTSQQLSIGNIRFGAMPGFLQTQIVPLIAEFQKQHPKVTFDVIGDDDPKAIMCGQSDVMLYYGPNNNPHLVEHWVTRSLFIPCAAPSYLERYGSPASPTQLVDHAGVIYNGKVRPLSPALVKGSLQETIHWKSEIRFNNILLAKTAALEGCGIVLDMPLHHCYQEILAGKLVPILNGWHIPNLDNYIGTTLEAHKLKRVQTFIDWYVMRRREIEGEQKGLVQEKFPFIVY